MCKEPVPTNDNESKCELVALLVFAPMFGTIALLAVTIWAFEPYRLTFVNKLIIAEMYLFLSAGLLIVIRIAKYWQCLKPREAWIADFLGAISLGIGVADCLPPTVRSEVFAVCYGISGVVVISVALGRPLVRRFFQTRSSHGEKGKPRQK